jgi:hypothetical protein
MLNKNSRVWSLPPIFWGILAIAAMLRIFAFDAFATHHPDEAIQYLEQAHRLVFGYGVVPWEYRYSIRSWLFPLLLAAPMQIGEWIDPGGLLYLILPRAFVAALNIAPVVAAWYLGNRSSRSHAIVAMLVVAIWVESVLFSVQTLTESLALACFLPAAAMLRRGAAGPIVVASGALLALACLLRFQYAPAIGAYAVVLAGRDLRLWRGLLMGGVPVIIGGGLIDLAMGQFPYEWIINNYQMNIAQGRMREIGGVSHSTYVVEYFQHLGFAALPVLLFAMIAGKRYLPLLVAAAVNLVFHQFIGHKEWRYLWLSIEILLILSAIGSVNIVKALLGDRFSTFGWTAVAAIAVAWSTASLALAASDSYRYSWRNDGGPSRLAAEAVRDPRVCGLAVNLYKNTLFGYALVHRNLPVYLLPDDKLPSLSRPGPDSKAFNAVLVGSMAPPPVGFPIRHACAGFGNDRMCLYTRPGACASDPSSRALEHRAELLRRDM